MNATLRLFQSDSLRSLQNPTVVQQVTVLTPEGDYDRNSIKAGHTNQTGESGSYPAPPHYPEWTLLRLQHCNEP